MNPFLEHPMTTITTADIEQRKATLIERGRAVRIMLDGAEARRPERAATVAVATATESKSTGAIRATVESATSDKTYTVTIDGPVRGRTRSMSCTCRDFGRNGRACKHIIAVGQRYITARRNEYLLLRDMAEMFGL
ncbi:MAG: hypothetical protein CMJ67_10805 [Planctomycetaceae bacterium]|nr:hypothetical protein [Planctomycetaceae bacterium]